MRQVAPLRTPPPGSIAPPLPAPSPDVRGIVLNALLLAAIGVAAAGVVSRFVPRWQPMFMAAACAVIALEAGAIHYVLRRDRLWLTELWRYLAPELLVMAAVMRVAATLMLGVATVSADARRWFLDPLSIFDGAFLAGLAVGLITGYTTHRTLQNLQDLAPRASDGTQDALNTYRVTLTIADERAEALRQLNGRLVTGGALILVLLSIESVDLTQFGAPGRPVALSSALAALSYLIAGFLLYSRARLALLRARWRNEGLAVADGVERRWSRSGLLLVAGVALLAVPLPRSYGLGLLDTVRTGLGLLTYTLALVGYMLIWVISLIALLPAWLLTMLFPGTQTAPVAVPPLPPLDPPLPERFVTEPNSFAALVFWLCMAALLGYALWMIAQRNPQLLAALLRFGPLRWLARVLGGLWRDTGAWVAASVERVSSAVRRPAAAAARVALPRLSQLTPRALVRYCYRSVLERAEAAGLRRRPGQTPHEYQQTLEREVPDGGADIAELTEAYVAARYAPQEPDQATARRVVRPWARLLRRLRRG